MGRGWRNHAKLLHDTHYICLNPVFGQLPILNTPDINLSPGDMFTSRPNVEHS